MKGVQRELFLPGKGLPQEKRGKCETHPQIDDDTCPVMICDSVTRFVAELANKNVPIEQKRKATGPCKVTGRLNAAKVATERIKRTLKMLRRMDDEPLASPDAANAFGCVDTHQLHVMF